MMKIDKLPTTIEQAFNSPEHRKLLIQLARLGRRGMVYKPENDVSNAIGCLFDLKLIHQRRKYLTEIIYCTQLCISKMLKHKLIELKDIPASERGGYR